MKKLLISLTALMLVLFVCISVMAENSSPATQLYDSLVQTLFHTDNITLTGTAKFSLDGVWFKTAKITLKQDGNRTFRELSLRGPKRDGTVQKNGYTIVTDGTALYLMEAVTPGVYRTGGTAEHTSLLRNSLETEQLIGILVLCDETEVSCEIGYGIGSRYWNQGYATEAVRRFIQYCFDEKGFQTVYASFFTGNDASRRIMEKCGMTYSHFSEKELTYLGVERDLTYYAISNPASNCLK